jgi:hypothetical protein
VFPFESFIFNVLSHISRAALVLSRLRMPVVIRDVQDPKVAVDGRNCMKAKPESLVVVHW